MNNELNCAHIEHGTIKMSLISLYAHLYMCVLVYSTTAWKLNQTNKSVMCVSVFMCACVFIILAPMDILQG